MVWPHAQATGVADLARLCPVAMMALDRPAEADHLGSHRQTERFRRAPSGINPGLAADAID